MQLDEVRPGTAGSALTPDLLEAYWPDARKRVMSGLQARGFDAETAEEATSEAATRALSTGVPVRNLDSFCRWLFVVARNVAADAKRTADRIRPVDIVPDRPDTYDLAGHVEDRQRLQHALDAMDTLSSTDRRVLLAAVEGHSHRPADRREEVKIAVRRHRARTRLRRALGQLGGWVGWLRRPALPWPFGGSAPELVGALLVPLLAAATGPLGARTGDEGLALPTTVAPSTASALTPGTDGRPNRLAPASRRPAPPATADAHAPTTASTAQLSATEWCCNGFTASPSYEEDHTVFATGGDASCGRPVGICPTLYKSTDGGATWVRLPAEGRDAGRILLPPAYPRDPRIFSASALTLSVSEDGGRTFRLISPVPGPASMSPRFSSADPRIVFGVDNVTRAAVPMQYVDGEAVLRPLQVPLPQHVVPLAFSFSSDARRVLVPAAELGLLAVPVQIRTTALYSCDDQRCERIIDFGSQALAPQPVWSSRPGHAFVGTTETLHRSTDGGRTFHPVALPVDRRVARLTALVAGPEGRLYASMSSGPGWNRLHVSDDDGTTWRLVAEDAEGFVHFTALPDGTLLDGGPGRFVRCSRDGGATWDGCGSR